MLNKTTLPPSSVESRLFENVFAFTDRGAMEEEKDEQ
jgi:hypothetical protein